MNTYHIHITTLDEVVDFKKTEIVLEKGQRKVHDTMWTKTVSLSGSVSGNIKELRRTYQQPKQVRFKLELLNQSGSIPEYSKKNYRELHLKLIIPNKKFLSAKVFLQAHAWMYGYSLSSNPREQNAEVTTQFINMRYTSGSYEDSSSMLRAITDFLKRSSFNIKEVKDEVVVYDSNLDDDSWWA